MPAPERRPGAGGHGALPARAVAVTGMTRATPGERHTTQTRPSRGVVVTPMRGQVRPYRGGRGAVTVTVSVGKAVNGSGAF